MKKIILYNFILLIFSIPNNHLQALIIFLILNALYVAYFLISGKKIKIPYKIMSFKYKPIIEVFIQSKQLSKLEKEYKELIK